MEQVLNMKLTDVTKEYKIKGGGAVKALDGISFELPERGMAFLLGKSGSGKTTLLNVMSGLDTMDGGEIEYKGRNLKSFTPAEMDSYRNTCCGFVFQEYNLIPELTVGGNVALALQLQGDRDTDAKVEKALKDVELEGYKNRRIYELSGGQKQRIAIARALIKNPEIIFADEPTGALDSATGTTILDLLKEISRQKLVVVVTHDRESAEKYADRIIELEDGRVIGDSAESGVAAQGEERTKAIEWKKPKMPLKAAVKIGCSNFKHHPIRLVWTILLAVIAFTFLGVSLTLSQYDRVRTFADVIHSSGAQTALIYKELSYYDENVIDQSLDQFLGADNKVKKQVYVTEEDLQLISSYNAGLTVLEFNSGNQITSFQSLIAASLEEIESAQQQTDKHIAISALGFMVLTEEDCMDLGYTVMGRLPENSSEIAISECLLNTFMIDGIKENGVAYSIESAEDIIGRKLPINKFISDTSWSSETEDKTITGIVYTGCAHKEALHHDSEQSFNDRIYISSDYFAEYTCALCTLPEEYDDVYKLAEFVLNYADGDYSYKFSIEEIGELYGKSDIAFMLKNLCLYLSAIFFLFAVLLIINLVSVSVRRQMKEIGILKSLGTDFKDLCKIYGGSNLILGSIISVITLIATTVGVLFVNVYLNTAEVINIIKFSAVAYISLVAIILAVSVMASIVPLIKLKKRSPSSIISQGQLR